MADFINHKLTRSFIIGALALTGLGLSGCRTAVVLVPPGAHCYTDSRPVCTVYYDYWGYPHRECHVEHYEHCARTLSVLGAAIGPVTMAHQYGLSVAAADRLINAMMDAKQGNFKTLMQLGLSSDDLMKLGAIQMPSDRGIDAVARNLNQSPDSIRNLISSMIQENRRMNHIADRLVGSN